MPLVLFFPVLPNFFFFLFFVPRKCIRKLNYILGRVFRFPHSGSRRLPDSKHLAFGEFKKVLWKAFDKC